MASIRTRITVSYALALAVTMFASSIALGYQRNQVAVRDLEDRVNTNVELAARILLQAYVAGEQIAILGDSLVGVAPRIASYLDAIPGFLFVLDSNVLVYASPAVQQLGQRDRQKLANEAFRLRPGARLRVTLDDAFEQVLMAGGRELPRAAGGVRRVVAGISSRAVAVADTPVLVLFFLVGPLILLVSVVAAWAISGRLLQPIGRMVTDVADITDGRTLHRRIQVEDLGDEVGELGETLNAMMARLEASFAGLRRFTADASHELKTPLAVLRADVERAMNAKPASEEQLVALEEALAETSRMTGLVEALLTLARADEGRFDLHRERVDLEHLVRDVLETAQILGEAANLKVTAAHIGPVAVLGDRDRLRQLFLNLVENAVKYTPRGGSVELSLEARDGSALFAVKDTGVGIAGVDLPFIFERFWRADRARTRGERGGSGLGLAICHWIAQAHGGSITVSSRMGRGSTFTVAIPVAPAAPAAIEA